MARWTGGDPGTGQGSGIRAGLPPQRPDQQFRPTGPQGPVGSSSSIVRARLVIVSGSKDGVFVYNGPPGAGSLVASVAAAAGSDQYGNQYFAGVWTYGNVVPVGAFNPTIGGGVLLQNAAVLFTEGVLITAGALLQMRVQGIVFAAPWIQLQAPQQAGSLDRASLTLLGGNTGGTTHGQALLALSPTALPATNSLLEVQGVVSLAEQASPPPTPTGAGTLYVDATGHLHYLGPAGTNTILANP